jgi:hypothetical protein
VSVTIAMTAATTAFCFALGLQVPDSASDLKDDVLEGYEEHHDADVLCS